MDKEEFKRIAAEAFPYIEEIRRIMAENKIDGLCSMAVDRDGYATMDFHSMPYSISQVGSYYSLCDTSGETPKNEELAWPIVSDGKGKAFINYSREEQRNESYKN